MWVRYPSAIPILNRMRLGFLVDSIIKFGTGSGSNTLNKFGHSKANFVDTLPVAIPSNQGESKLALDDPECRVA